MTPGGLLRPLLRRRIVQALARAYDGGVIAEVGVYRGRSAAWIARSAPRARLLLFDTFCGMPKPGPVDWHKLGDFGSTSVDFVRSVVPGALVFPGLFPRTAEGAPRPDFVHLDADLYETARAAFELWPDAVFLVDDYGATTCPGVRLAVHESGRRFVPMITEQAVVFPLGEAQL